jgi:hypothetical protein
MIQEKTIVIDEDPTSTHNPLYSRKKMIFLINALEDGWNVKKTNNNTFVLRKKHKGIHEIFLDSYLEKFIESHMKER